MRWIKLLVTGLIGIAVFIFLFSLFFPRVGHVEREGVISAKPAVLFDNIDNVQQIVKWIPWGQTNPDLHVTFSDPAQGTGAWYKWYKGDDTSTVGEFRITNVIPDKQVDYILMMKGMPVSTGSFILALATDGRSTWIKWTLNTHVGWTPWWKYYGLMMDRLIGPGMEVGLNKLKSFSENNADNQLNIQEIKVPYIFVATISDTLDNQSDERNILPGLYKKVEDFVAKNHLEKVAHPIAQFVQPDEKHFVVNAGIPVNTTAPPTDHIKVLQMPDGNVLVAHYTGPYSGLKIAYDALHEYAREHGKQSPAGPWEEYIINAASQKDSTKWQTNVYFPVF